jgi:hypothetical protein
MSEVCATADSTDSADIADARRANQRFPLNSVFEITPLDRDRELLRSAQFVALAKDVSVSGLAVSHERPIRHSRVVITRMRSGDGQFCIEATVAWTRAVNEGSYESGFKFIRKMS